MRTCIPSSSGLLGYFYLAEAIPVMVQKGLPFVGSHIASPLMGSEPSRDHPVGSTLQSKGIDKGPGFQVPCGGVVWPNGPE